ncbi:MAG: OmpA family protein [Saprospiraceae bacterium]|nr:OmpA family protein [Saprospiraceae bacterium]
MTASTTAPAKPAGPSCNGCPFADRDGDGVADADDVCPDTRGYIGLKGCLDADKDRIIDPLDKCPDLAGIAANNGCPPLPEKAKKVLITAMRSVQFETGSAVIKKQSYTILNQVADVILTYDYYKLSIEGHTDSRGNDKANKKLSESRAAACLKYLAKKGVAPERMRAAGWGESKPVATNKTDKGRRLNRRVEFRLYLE